MNKRGGCTETPIVSHPATRLSPGLLRLSASRSLGTGGAMVEDEILREVWRNRDAFAKRHRYNLDAMVEELRQMERQSPNKLVDRSGESVKKTRRRKRQRSDR